MRMLRELRCDARELPGMRALLVRLQLLPLFIAALLGIAPAVQQLPPPNPCASRPPPPPPLLCSHGIWIWRCDSKRPLLSILACACAYLIFLRSVFLLSSSTVCQDFTKCMQDEGTKQPSQCKLAAEDYVECLHHHKQVRMCCIN